MLRLWPSRFARPHGPLRQVVERVLREFLRCGLLEHGFARLWCAECRRSVLVASTGEDNTLRLWPMPDLDRPPLHTLPHTELLAKLKSLTNLRAVRYPKAQADWKLERGPFPGWKDLPTW